MPRSSPAWIPRYPSLQQRVSRLSTRDELQKLLRLVRADWEAHPEAWCNAQLDAVVETIAVWVDKLDEHYAETGHTLSDAPSWRALGERLLSARRHD